MSQVSDRGDFCFDCASSHEDDQPLDPPTFNPWPYLVRPDLLGHLRCQPLVRLVYSPRPLVQLLALLRDDWTAQTQQDELEPFADRTRVAHEYVHFLVLDRTPAKELARAHLAYAYDLYGLMTRMHARSDTLIEALWQSFLRANIRLSQILSKIGFIEELLATGFALAMLESDVQLGATREHLADVYLQVKEETLSRHEDAFPGFLHTYTQLEPLIRLMARGPTFFNQVMPLLQPIYYDENNQDLVAIDPREHLLGLVAELSHVESIDAAKQIVRQRREQYDSDWKLALALQEANAQEPEIVQGEHRILYGRFAQVLSSISRGDMVYTRSVNAEEVSDFSFDAGPMGLVLLSLGHYRRRPTLERMTLFVRGSDETNELRSRYSTMVHFEGLRQQLCAKRGIVCPENPAGRRQCQCSPGTRQAVHAIADLALRGYFGAGDWSRPTCRA